MQAQFLIPMAVSLAFGLIFATVIILLLVPSVYLIIEDIRELITGHEPPAASSTGESLIGSKS